MTPIVLDDTPECRRLLVIAPLTLPIHKHLTRSHRGFLLVDKVDLGSRTSFAPPSWNLEQVRQLH